METKMTKRPIALITGVSRKDSIGAAVARSLAESGWDVAVSYWRPYDETMEWGSHPGDLDYIARAVEQAGGRFTAVESDLSSEKAPEQIFDKVNSEAGDVTALILSHCHSVDSDILSTTLESFDRHFAVNTRASWLLVREFGLRFKGKSGTGRIISLTSDHTAWNMPYGASKGAMDRIILASATEFREKGIKANAVNPGATDTGWISDDLKIQIRNMTLSGRVGVPQDAANLIAFLCSPEGGWINGQLLYSNGGIQ